MGTANKLRANMLSPCMILGFSVMFSVILLSVKADSFCQDGDNTAPQGFQPSDYFRASSSAETYTVDQRQGITLRMHLHYSSKEERAGTYFENSDLRPELRFNTWDFKAQKGYAFEGGKCKEISKQPENDFLTWKIISDYGHATYDGQKEINGEKLHNWRCCYSKGNYDYKEDLFMSGYHNSWGSPWGRDFTPVKVVQQRREKTTMKTDSITHHVLKFVTRDDNDSKFQADLWPPVGVVCPNADRQPIPALPESLVYSLEDASKDVTHTISIDVGNKLNGEVTSFLPSSAPTILITDSYDLGAMVEIADSACRFFHYVPVNDDGLNHTVSLSSSSGSALDLKNVDEIIGRKESYTFNGLQDFRGIPCYAYSEYYETYKGSRDVTFVLYFSKPGVTMTNNVGSVVSTESVLVGKAIFFSGKNYALHSFYNLGDLDYSRLPFDPFDIGECADELGGAIDFNVWLKTPGSDPLVLDGAKRSELKLQARAALAKSSGTSELRVAVKEIASGPGMLLLTARLLEKLPDSIQLGFSAGGIEDTSTIASDKVVGTFDANSANDCQYLRYLHPETKFVSYCFFTGKCILLSTQPYKQLEMQRCVGYYISDVEVEETLEFAYQSLSTDIETGNLKVNKYVATNLEKIDVSADNLQPLAINRYEKTPGAGIDEGTETLQHTRLDKCAEACTESVGYACEVFTHCPKLNLCRLNHNPDVTSVRIKEDQKCNVYRRKYSTEFNPVPATFAVTNTELIYELIDDPDKCARLCVFSTDFRCESFDFCTLDGGSGSGTCSLGRQHYYELIESDSTVMMPQTQCTHYSRNYLGDYDKRDGVTQFDIIVQVRKSTPEGCAKDCSQSASCSMFHFCAAGHVCELVDDSAIHSDGTRQNPPLKKKLSCSTYVLNHETLLMHSRFDAKIAAYQGGSGAARGQYGSGSMAGLAFAALFVGIGLLFLGLFGWVRYQKAGGLSWVRNLRGEQGNTGSFDNPSMKFSDLSGQT